MGFQDPVITLMENIFSLNLHLLFVIIGTALLVIWLLFVILENFIRSNTIEIIWTFISALILINSFDSYNYEFSQWFFLAGDLDLFLVVLTRSALKREIEELYLQIKNAGIFVGDKNSYEISRTLTFLWDAIHRNKTNSKKIKAKINFLNNELYLFDSVYFGCVLKYGEDRSEKGLVIWEWWKPHFNTWNQADFAWDKIKDDYVPFSGFKLEAQNILLKLAKVYLACLLKLQEIKPAPINTRPNSFFSFKTTPSRSLATLKLYLFEMGIVIDLPKTFQLIKAVNELQSLSSEKVSVRKNTLFLKVETLTTFLQNQLQNRLTEGVVNNESEEHFWKQINKLINKIKSTIMVSDNPLDEVNAKLASLLVLKNLIILFNLGYKIRLDVFGNGWLIRFISRF